MNNFLAPKSDFKKEIQKDDSNNIFKIYLKRLDTNLSQIHKNWGFGAVFYISALINLSIFASGLMLLAVALNTINHLTHLNETLATILIFSYFALFLLEVLTAQGTLFSIPSGRYNENGFVHLFDSDGNVYIYQGPTVLLHGNTKNGKHVVGDGKGLVKYGPVKYADEVINRMAKENDIDETLLLISCNSEGGKLGDILIPCIHARGDILPLKVSGNILDRHFNKASRFYAEDGWYIALPNGQEYKLARAIKEGIIKIDNEQISKKSGFNFLSNFSRLFAISG
jgi:hypothetical protein